MRRLVLLATAVIGAIACLGTAPAWPREPSSQWQVPPGDPLEHSAAGFAKILCSAVFISGRDLATAIAEDGFFVAPRAERRLLKPTLDTTSQTVSVSLPNGLTRTAKLIGNQGCVTLPAGARSVLFTPVPVTSTLPDAQTQLWPMGDAVPDGAPAAEIDQPTLAAAVAAAFEPPQGLTAAFVVAHKGRIIAERYAAGSDRDTRLPGWSMGKSVTATLLGQLVNEGALQLWAPAPIEEWQGPQDPRRDIRIADLLRMSSGLHFIAPQDPDFDPARGYPDHLFVYTGAIDAYRWAISRPAQWSPNTVGRYRNSDPLVLNALIKRAIVARGEDYLSYPQRRLFDRLGIRRFVLETDPYGNFLLQGYELGSARDWLRLGLLYQQEGLWNGERLLPEGWSNFVRTPAPAWSEPIYGALFWLNRMRQWPVPEDAYYMAGSGGQITLIVPTHDLVVVRLGHYQGEALGTPALARALSLVLRAVPQSRAPWQPPRLPP
ncbi:MAG TPA: serine hydrolase [Hyphomicrobiaceae bacterium]|nr:serine hydrolase [Hyphomicrobiaceae bacterium]